MPPFTGSSHPVRCFRPQSASTAQLLRDWSLRALRTLQPAAHWLWGHAALPRPAPDRGCAPAVDQQYSAQDTQGASAGSAGGDSDVAEPSSPFVAAVHAFAAARDAYEHLFTHIAGLREASAFPAPPAPAFDMQPTPTPPSPTTGLVLEVAGGTLASRVAGGLAAGFMLAPFEAR